jgi:polyisoprenoid-binding protein YceI
MALARRTLGVVAGVAVVVIIAAVAGGWWFFIRDDAPESASIEAAGETLDEAGSGDVAADDGVDGSWAVDTTVGSFDDFSGTWAGYRVNEELAGIGGKTAVGRTPGVSGTMTVDGDEVTEVDVEVDLTTLQSDDGNRDNAIKSRGLQSDQFPTATFTLTEPIPVPDELTEGQNSTASATGELTLHGVTKPVTVSLDVRLDGGSAAVVGKAPVKLTDFGMEAPTTARVLSIQDDAEFEFQIFFTRS